MKTIHRSLCCFVSVVLGALLIAPCFAQNAPPTLEELANTIQILERQVEMQKDRVEMVVTKWKALDEQMERRIERVVETVVQSADSKDSGTKVLKIKADLFDGLLKQIEFLNRERGQRFSAMYRPSSWATKEGLAADVVWLNQRIEKRIDQALAVIASLPDVQDLPRPTTTTTTYSGGYTYSSTDTEYQHKWQMQGQSKVLREKAVARLKAGVDRLRRGRMELERAFNAARTEEGRAFVKEMIQLDDALVAKREGQIENALMNRSPGRKTLSKSSADGLVEMVANNRLSNQRDQSEWIRLKNERELNRQQLNNLESRLANCRAAYQQMVPVPAEPRKP
jgi:outer membrane murein-binding lipoprotein Lpp